MSIVEAVLAAIIIVALLCPLAWLILSNWLFGRSLIIATVATATAVSLGRFSYAGPVNAEAMAALAGSATSVLTGLLVARVWLQREAIKSGQING